MIVKKSSIPPQNNFFNRISIVLLYLCMLAGVALRFWNLNHESFWGDEIYSALAATCKSFGDMISRFALSDAHPPLYHILLMGWARIFGSSEWALRSSSALASIAAIFFMYHLTKKALGQKTASLATLLLIFSTAAIVYAQELRSYSLLLLFSTIITLLWLKLIYQYQGTIPSKDFAIYTTIAVITSYLHYFGFILVGFQIGYLVVLCLVYKRYYKQVGLVMVSWLMVFLPWIIYRLSTLTAFCGGNFWTKRWPFMVFFKEFITFVFFCAHPERFLYRRIFFVALLLLGAFYLFKSRNKLTIPHLNKLLQPLIPLIYLMLVPYTALYFASYHTPLLEARFLIILLPAFYLSLAYFLNNTLPYQAAFILVLTVWGFLAGIYTIQAGHKITKQQFRESTEYALQMANESAIIASLTGPNQTIKVDQYYLEQFKPRYNKRNITFCVASKGDIMKLIKTAQQTHSAVILLRNEVPPLSPGIEELLQNTATTYSVKEFRNSTVYVCTF